MTLPYTDPEFPSFPFKVRLLVSTTLRSYHAGMGQNLGQVAAGTVVLATERDGHGEDDLWLRLKDAPTNDHPDGRDGWVKAKYVAIYTPLPGTVPMPTPAPPPVPLPTSLTELEQTIAANVVILLRLLRAYIRA